MQSNKNKILPGNCSKGRDKWYVLAKLYKNNIAEWKRFTANQNSSETVKGLNHFSTFLLFIMTLTIKFSAMLSLCWFGDHALLSLGSRQWCWGFKPPGLWLLVIFSLFFLCNWTTQTQEMHMILNQKQKGDGLIIEEEKLVLQPYYYQLTKLSLSSPLSLFWHLQMSVWNFTPITNILISYILDWREKSQSLLIQLLSIRYFKTGQIISLEIRYHKILKKL